MPRKQTKIRTDRNIELLLLFGNHLFTIYFKARVTKKRIPILPESTIQFVKNIQTLNPTKNLIKEHKQQHKKNNQCRREIKRESRLPERAKERIVRRSISAASLGSKMIEGRVMGLRRGSSLPLRTALISRI